MGGRDIDGKSDRSGATGASERGGRSERNDTSDPSVDTPGANERVECPYCGSTDTERDHPKGPSLCRSMHYCRGCEQPFERFE